MTTLRQLISAVTLLILASAASAQVFVTESTPNLITSGANHTWQGVVTNNTHSPGVGPLPVYVPNSNFIVFSYNEQTVSQIIGINTALAHSGSGLQISGVRYSWDYFNTGSNSGTLSGNIGVTSNTGNVLYSYSHVMPLTAAWASFSQVQTFGSLYDVTALGEATVSFTGVDYRNTTWQDRYYGPAVRNVNLRFDYSVDLCTRNPASSPSCAGYADVITSPNLVPVLNHWTTNGQSINQTYAINQALSVAGAGIMIHGFDYGYRYNLGSSYSQCTAHNQDGSCSWTMTFNPQINVSVGIRDNNNVSIYNINHIETGVNTGNRSRDYQYRFSNSRDALTLGNFTFTASTAGNSTIWDMYSRAVYTPDQCMLNPLGDPNCPGYAAALFTQQCTADALYDPTCPGYATAFYNYQCSLNALYHTGCPGYATAYFNQQCSISALYSESCPGYADAIYIQQCTADPLYDSGCTGYAQAYALKFIINSPGTATPTSSAVEEPTAVAAAVAEEKPVAVAVESAPPAATARPAEPAAPVQLVAAAPAPTATQPAASAAPARTEPAAAAPTRTTRQAVAEQRQAAAREAAAREAQDNPGAASAEMDAADSLERQVEIQNVVLGAMGFVAGFDAYGRVALPDGVGYAPSVIYPGQRNIDTPAARGLTGRSDRIHEEMVNEQWNR